MLTLTHGVAAAILAVTAILFQQGSLSAVSLTALWCAVFFFASAAASAAYLTVSGVPAGDSRTCDRVLLRSGTGLGGILGPPCSGS